MNKLSQVLRRHPLLNMLSELEGNPRICVLTEPLWGIPYNLYSPYVGLYMAALGLSDYRIGLVAAAGTFFQMFGALFGGVITDKLGRRRTTFLFDIISWSIPALIWMCAQNFWWFFAAIIFNSMWQVTDNAWSCLLVEDCDQKKLVDVYTWVSVSGLLAVFFAPLSGFLVNTFSLVPAVRILYFVTFVMMSTKFIILYTCCTETEQGKKRLKETRHTSMLGMLSGYQAVFKKLVKNPATIVVLSLKILLSVSQMVNTNFFGLYITRGLNIPTAMVALFPMVRAVVMLIFIFTVQHIINRMKFRPIMLAGGILYFLANILLLLTTQKSLWMLLIYLLMDAFSWALLIPRQDSLMVVFVDEAERARTLGLIFVITLAFTAPFGVIVGKLSETNMRFPFVLNAVLFLLLVLLVFYSPALKDYDRKNENSLAQPVPDSE
ncbi:MAG: MFS transporter [Angelakisella sp.]